MDSLTQIVLGAAVGEVAMGKKIGNRAMAWGAIAGTIPDLDVFVGKLFFGPTGALAFHRGISHSIFFAVFFSFLISWLVSTYYRRGYHNLPIIKYLCVIAMIGAVLLLGGGGIGIMTVLHNGVAAMIGLFFVGLAVLLGSVVYTRFWKEESVSIDYSWKEWYVLFFWAILTHPLLDCCTTYGTQLFQPFTNYRVSFNIISVVDPIYTLPFLLCLIWASSLMRGSRKRAFVNSLGIILSSIYLMYTLTTKWHVHTVMKNTLASQSISYDRFMTMPTFMNSILWSGTVETDSLYYWGQYSIMDSEKVFKLRPIPKNHTLLEEHPDDYALQTLDWFSDGYYNIENQDGKQVFSDLRFGMSEISKDSFYVNFNIDLYKDAQGKYEINHEPGPPEGMDANTIANRLYDRIKGK